MSKCLRCGAGSKWLQGTVAAETFVEATENRDKRIAELERCLDGDVDCANERISLSARVAKLEEVLREVKLSMLRLNKQVSTFGVAYSVIMKIDAALDESTPAKEAK